MDSNHFHTTSYYFPKQYWILLLLTIHYSAILYQNCSLNHHYTTLENFCERGISSDGHFSWSSPERSLRIVFTQTVQTKLVFEIGRRIYLQCKNSTDSLAASSQHYHNSLSSRIMGGLANFKVQPLRSPPYDRGVYELFPIPHYIGFSFPLLGQDDSSWFSLPHKIRLRKYAAYIHIEKGSINFMVKLSIFWYLWTLQ